MLGPIEFFLWLPTVQVTVSIACLFDYHTQSSFQFLLFLFVAVQTFLVV